MDMVEKSAVNNKQQCEEGRACHYAILSRLFADQTTPVDMASYLEILESLTGEYGELAGAFSRELHKWLQKDNADHFLKTEYARLFIMPGGIRPYESVYRGDAPLLMRDPWLEVKRFYHRCGMKLENPARQPEDHASAELAFMVYLIETGGRKDEEEAFFRRHLVDWIPRMLEELKQNEQASFYKDAAVYGLSFMESERMYFGRDT